MKFVFQNKLEKTGKPALFPFLKLCWASKSGSWTTPEVSLEDPKATRYTSLIAYMV